MFMIKQQVIEIINFTMTTEIGKVINIYEHTLSLLKAKSQIFIQQNQNVQLLQPVFSGKFSQQHFETWPKYMERSIQNLLRIWKKKFYMFHALGSRNNLCITQIELKLNDLKSNKSLLSKEYQQINQMQNRIKQEKQINDPLIYYDVKRRADLKEWLQKKVLEVKDNLSVTKKSQAPLYMRKVQQQLKNTIYSVSRKQSKIDQEAIESAAAVWQRSIQHLFHENVRVKKTMCVKYITQMNNEFYQTFYELMNKRVKLNHNLFVKYFQALNQLLKFILRFWNDYLKDISQLTELLSFYEKVLKSKKEDLQKRQANVINLLQKSNKTVNNIFKIDTALRIIATFSLILQINKLVSNLSKVILSVRQTIKKNINACTNYIKELSGQIPHRQKQFFMFCTDDRNFIESQAKYQFVIERKLIQNYQQFLTQCFKISKKNHKIFLEEDLPSLQSHQIASLLTRQIASNNVVQQKNTYKSQFASDSGSGDKSNQKSKKNQKIIQIEEFLKQFMVFDPSNINWHRNNIFSCALGPRLLLHGSIAALQQGLYFQSFFNKKNLFFGKTKLFIPRSHISEIGTTNTLIVFPDAVQVKTQVGSIYFHALGSRQTINNTLNQIYFPQNNPDSDQNISLISFNQVSTNQSSLYSPKQKEQLQKNYQNILIQSSFQGIKLNKFFKRYFSDQKFQIRGQEYDNFKTYLLLQVEAMQPKNTPLTPQPPTYFFYKKQECPSKSDPKLSERIHTYRKKIPKIPFLSNGGDGFCEDKQIYHWLSPKSFVIDTTSTVKGFSLTQNMLIKIKIVCSQLQQNRVKLSCSSDIKFGTDSASNNLLKGPALTNIKQCMVKMIDIIEKYQKGKKSRKNKSPGEENKEMSNEFLEQKIQKLTQQNQKIKKYFKISIVIFIVIYIMTIILIRLSMG